MNRLQRKTSGNGIQLPIPGCSVGRMGPVALGRDYLAGVEARARRLAKATRIVREKCACEGE